MATIGGYSKTTWENKVEGVTEGTKVNATNMNNIENQVELIDTDYAAHKSDYVYQTAGGTGTAITLTGLVLEDGHPKTFIATADNSGAATTVNTKSLYKPNTTDAPNIITGKAYTIWYDEGEDCFFLKASAEGTAVAGNVLDGTTFSNDDDTGITGTMPNKAGNNIQSHFASDMSINEGYYNGSGEVLMPVVTAGGNILNSTHMYGNTVISYYTEIDYRYVKLKGTYRVSFYLYTSHSGNTVYGRVYINDIAVGIERSTTTEYPGVNFSQDFSGLEPGDKVSIYAHGNGDVVSAYISNGFICINEVLLPDRSA